MAQTHDKQGTPDYLIRATAMGGKVRAIAARTTCLTEQIRSLHHAAPTATAALGRTLATAVMMGAMLKDKQKLTIQVKGNGPLGQIVVDANAGGDVRGFVDHPGVDLPLNSHGKLDVAGAVGTEGYIYIIKDMGLKEPYRGSVPIVSGELGEDFTYYFAKSEQTPSAVAVGVLIDVDRTVKASGGMIIQLLPGISDEEVAQIESHISRIHSITSLIDAGLSMEMILHEVLEDVHVLETKDIGFKCNCSQDRVKQMLVSLGEAELKSILEEDGQAEIICHFCNRPYRYGEHDLHELLQSFGQASD